MTCPIRLRIVPALALGALLLAATRPAAAVELGEVLNYLGFDSGAEQRLRAGEILSKRIQEGAERTELAISVIGLFEVSLAEAHASVLRGETLEVDRNVVAHGELTAWPPDPAQFAGVEFTAEEASEVGDLLHFRGGSGFNLSTEEIARFRGLSGREAVSAAYREVLLGRYRAYREQGLPGLAPYDRGSGKKVKPAETLRLAADAARFLRENEPQIFSAFTAFPSLGAGGVEHLFYWFKQDVQGRPTFVLSHRMLFTRPDRALLAERQYFIGHSYNTVQIVTGALPVPEGIAVLYTSRTSIDQMAGITGRVARPIAAGRVADRVRERFEAMRARQGDAT